MFVCFKEQSTEKRVVGDGDGAPGQDNHIYNHFKVGRFGSGASILSWRNPWTEEPGGLQTMGW